MISKTPPWVLHIEDDEEFSAVVKLRLEAHGVAVVRAANGVEGYTTAFMQEADAILLDYEVPGAEGDYILRRLKDNPVTKDIPVIVLTGRRDQALVRQMLNLGAERCFTKPVDFDALLTELRRHIDVLPSACGQLAL
jgi:DNA-binding response OmpR family regulator